MLHWIEIGIVYLCSHGSPSCCMGLIVTLLICVLVPLPHVVFDWLWYCLSVFSWFFLMLHWIDCGIVYLFSHWSSSCSIVLIVTVYICILLFLPFLHWIDCDIVYLCSYGFSSCCIGLIVTLFVFVLVVLPHVALDWLWYCWSVFSWLVLMLYLIDCDIVYLCSQGSSSLHRIDCGIIYLCSHWSSSCCIVLIVTVFICVLMVFPHVALDWLRYCLPVFSWFFLMLPWIDCDIVFSVFSWFFVMLLLIIVTLFIFVLVVLPHIALDSLLHCLCLFLWFFLMMYWIDCDIVFLCSYGSTSCCIELIEVLFICVLMVFPHVALDWLWHFLSVFLWFFIMLHWIDCGIVYLCSYGSSLCCIGLIVTLFNLCFYGSTLCCIG